jgi:SAM-dependent methyltransferase
MSESLATTESTQSRRPDHLSQFRGIRAIENAARLLGLEPRRGLRNLSRLSWFARQRREYLRLAKRSGGEFPVARLYPCLDDIDDDAGTAKGHYFHQDLHVARKIFRRSPRRHVDVGSRIDGFVAHVASFRDIEVFDIRSVPSLPGITFVKMDLINDAPPKDYADSVSCLHALEHFGLGRYGDPLDYYGHEKGLANLAHILEPGGVLYLSTPMGPQRTEFNAHRVLSPRYVLDLAARHSLSPIGFSYVDDLGDLHSEVEMTEDNLANNFGCVYGCGIYEFQKS